MQSNEELLTYIVSSGKLQEETLLGMIRGGTLTIEIVLSKLSLFMRHL